MSLLGQPRGLRMRGGLGELDASFCEVEEGGPCLMHQVRIDSGEEVSIVRHEPAAIDDELDLLGCGGCWLVVECDGDAQGFTFCHG